MKVIMKVLMVLTFFYTLLPLTVSGSSVQYTVRALIPENQVDKKQTYFDLRLLEGETQTLQVEITNASNKDLVAAIGLNPATTGRDGIIVYHDVEALELTLDESLVLPITDIAQLNQSEILIGPKETEIVEIELQMPDEEIEGTVLGGITVRADNVNNLEQADNTGISLKNQFVYVIGLKITSNDAEFMPDIKLKSISPELINYRPSVVFTLQNPQPMILKGLEINAQVFKEDGSGPVKELHLTNAEMAPNSNGQFVIDWEDEQLAKGNYTLDLKAHYSGEIWEWHENFSIGAAIASDINKGAVVVEDTFQMPYKWLFALLLLIIALLAYYLGKHSRKEKIKQ